jgi:hypothetical protein
MKKLLMTSNAAPTRRRALQALGAMVVMPASSLASTRTVAEFSEESANSLWRPVGSLRVRATEFEVDEGSLAALDRLYEPAGLFSWRETSDATWEWNPARRREAAELAAHSTR